MSNWPQVSLDDVFDIARGGSPRPIDKFITDDPDGVNWIMIGDASASSKYIKTTKKKIRKEGVSRSRVVGPGDFLLTNSMSFGRPYIMGTSGCIHDGWLVLSPRESQVDPDYFYHLLGSDVIYREFERRAAGATVKNLNIDLVKGVEIALPPLEEQRRLASILDQADLIRSFRSRSIKRLRDLQQSIFYQMFESEVASDDAECLGELVHEFRYGTSNKSSEVGSAALRIPNVVGGRIDLTDLKNVAVTDRERERLRLRGGDLLFVRTNGNPSYVGRCAVVPDHLESKELIFASYLIRARLPNVAVATFVQAYLETPHGRKQLAEKSKTSAGQYNINIEGLSSIRIPRTPNKKKEIFADKLENAKRPLANYENSQRVLQELFSCLQQRAFRGEL